MQRMHTHAHRCSRYQDPTLSDMCTNLISMFINRSEYHCNAHTNVHMCTHTHMHIGAVDIRTQRRHHPNQHNPQLILSMGTPVPSNPKQVSQPKTNFVDGLPVCLDFKSQILKTFTNSISSHQY